ncbi:hypothetical protein [Rathayibacter tanaceti]|uniref:Uncharacterized protein n=2 Tax=Rathayibacter tanaceti TaxID=1671680 RepID=A0A166I998_9MICO|nr:hypothetical protein [Rathayibacter tanaceti]KZX21983.1 hypothetical protein ACH61_00902 [Rathayibacter tanaceti]QHC56772.1 hypothetical protein GSU10_14805 [Rathayibacter tanaceti]TCO33744.1 hypothetical protein EV639_11427 [Rathayibacter tanaceti]
MTPAAPEAILPAAALVFPLLVGAALLVSGIITVRSVLRGSERGTSPRGTSAARARSVLAAGLGDAGLARGPAIALAALRIAAGALLLVSSGPTYTAAALVAALLCALALLGALRAFAQAPEEEAQTPATVAAAAALLAFATAAAAQGILGFTGVPAHLGLFDHRDLSWAAALVGVLAACSLLQLAGRVRGPATPPGQSVRRHG